MTGTASFTMRSSQKGSDNSLNSQDLHFTLGTLLKLAKKIGWVTGYYCDLTAPGKQHSQLGIPSSSLRSFMVQSPLLICVAMIEEPNFLPLTTTLSPGINLIF